MFRVFTCLTNEHDWRLILLAGIVCFLASLAAVNLMQRARATRGRVRTAWILTAGAATGYGIWATHFIAMLAYDPGVAIGYDIGLTAMSLLAAIVVTSAGIDYAVNGRSRWAAPAGGGIVGAGIACMHYLGMSALQLPGSISWSSQLVAASVSFGVLFGVAAFPVMVRGDRMFRSLAAGLLLTVAIVSLHFTAMGAVEIIPDPTRMIDNSTISSRTLALAIACAAVAVLGISLIAGISDRRSKELLRAQNEKLDAALNNMSQGLTMFDSQARLVLANARYIEMYGLDPAVVKPGATLRELVEHRIARGSFFTLDPEKYIADFVAAMSGRIPATNKRELSDGRAISVIDQPIDGGGWVVTHQDITDRHRAEQDLERTRRFLDTVIEHVPLTIVVKDARDLRYVLINRTGEQYYGIPRDRMIGFTTADIFPKSSADLINEHDNKLLETRQPQFSDEHPIETPGNGVRVVVSTRLPIIGSDGAPQYVVTVIQDVTERKRAEARIARLAHYDSLTDLPNRTVFNECFAHTLEQAAKDEESFAVLYLDLDRFNEVNDGFGQAVGDALLRALARRLSAAAEGAFLARIGGDEFAIVITDGAQPGSAAQLAERVLAAVANEEFDVDGHLLRTSVSIGIAIYPADGANAASLIANADAALHRAKAEGRGTFRFFEAQMDDRLRERRALVHDLRSAVSRGELVLYYQPQAKVDGEIFGFEGLVRWQHPTRGFITPSAFIPAAEESGLVLSIGEWILREACREAAAWPKPLNIAINLSPVQFRHGDLPGLVHSVLLETGLAPHRLELEITENVLIDDLSRAISILCRLKTLGVRIAMDDFGTGYSSLSTLQSFPFDKIKIDQSFISNLETNPHSATIVRTVIALGRGLDLPVIAEGVETKEQLAFLRSEACTEVQGYLIGKPLPISAYAGVVGAAPAAELAAAAVA